MSNFGVVSMGVKCPIIREGDDVVKIVTESILKTRAAVGDNDVIGVTESVVARSAGLYVTVDEIAEDIKKKYGENATITLFNMIYSRNRFSMILKGIARGAKKLVLYMPAYDEVGNPSGVNPFTGVNIKEYYKELIENEGCVCEIHDAWDGNVTEKNLLYCGLHDYVEYKHDVENMNLGFKVYTLADICSDKNPDFGLLGTNKATEEKLKLFPTVELAEKVAYGVQKAINEATGKNVNVIIYGDGCFHSPSLSGIHGSSIWEFADPVTVPGHTHGILDGKPNEIKIKAFADDKFKDLRGEELNAAVKNEITVKEKSLVGNMNAEGTTPRKYVDLLASLCDLTSGSGDKGTPVVWIQGYFNNYAD